MTRRDSDERGLDLLDYASLIHSSLGDIQPELERIAVALERAANALEAIAVSLETGQ